MDVLAPAMLDVAPTPAETVAGPERPTRLLLFAVLWVLGGIVAGVGAAFLAGVVVGVHNGLTARVPGHAWKLAPAVYGLICIAVTDVVLLWAAWRRGRVVGRGDAIAGLGGGPIRRPRLLVAFAIVGAPIVFGWLILLSHWLKPPDHTGITALLSGTARSDTFIQAAIVLCVIGLSPLWEEAFFRGWLWTGLRRHWRPLPVALATAFPWLLLHLSDGLLRPLFLIPAAIMFSLARHYCGSVRASLVLHILNNLIAVAIVILALASGHP